jgi:response regulator RpfG family c-di-GMP phosphodiesterase
LPLVDHLDLVITDVYMPGINGLEFLSTLRSDPATTRHVPVILYTATYKSSDLEAKAKALGAFSVLSKPSDPEVILEHVRAALNSKTQESTATILGIERSCSETRPAETPGPHLGYRFAALIEIMMDLAEERDSGKLTRTFCQGAKELINVREASVHIVAPGTTCSFLPRLARILRTAFPCRRMTADLSTLREKPRGGACRK